MKLPRITRNSTGCTEVATPIIMEKLVEQQNEAQAQQQKGRKSASVSAFTK